MERILMWKGVIIFQYKDWAVVVFDGIEAPTVISLSNLILEAPPKWEVGHYYQFRANKGDIRDIYQVVYVFDSGKAAMVSKDRVLARFAADREDFKEVL